MFIIYVQILLQPLDSEEEAHCIAGLSLQDMRNVNKLIEHTYN